MCSFVRERERARVCTTDTITRFKCRSARPGWLYRLTLKWNGIKQRACRSEPYAFSVDIMWEINTLRYKILSCTHSTHLEHLFRTQIETEITEQWRTSHTHNFILASWRLELSTHHEELMSACVSPHAYCGKDGWGKEEREKESSSRNNNSGGVTLAPNFPFENIYLNRGKRTR